MRFVAKIFLAVGILLNIGLVYLLLQPTSWALFDAQGAELLSMVWGKISMLDVYAGFMLSLALVWLLEPRMWVRVLMTLTLPVLGNPVLAIWLVVRFRYLLARTTPNGLPDL